MASSLLVDVESGAEGTSGTKDLGPEGARATIRKTCSRSWGRSGSRMWMNVTCQHLP